MIQSNFSSSDCGLIDTSSSVLCKACGLYLNQQPVLDIQKKSHVFWVGLSSVLITDDKEWQPLSPFTRSGALIDEIEKPFKNKMSFYKTNVVKCLPLNNDKIRYPVRDEMEKCFSNLELEIDRFKPSVVFLLGKQVATFVIGKFSKTEIVLDDKFKYHSVISQGIRYIPIHHPSFILVYKRKFTEDYINSIQSFFSSAIISNFSCKNSKVSQALSCA
jgi:uracil-DNA glycosylase